MEGIGLESKSLRPLHASRPRPRRMCYWGPRDHLRGPQILNQKSSGRQTIRKHRFTNTVSPHRHHKEGGDMHTHQSFLIVLMLLMAADVVISPARAMSVDAQVQPKNL